MKSTFTIPALTVSAFLLSACASIPAPPSGFEAIHAQCHYSVTEGCAAYDGGAISLGGLLYYPAANALETAALYPAASALPAHDTAKGWSSALLRSAIVLDISAMTDNERAELTRLHLKPVRASGTVHNDCVLSARATTPRIDNESFAPPAPLEVSCPSPNQITLYLTDVSLTESLSL